jgi:uncharacterized protein (DUF1697 family)
MADLRALVEQRGGEDVSTYVQSGNVVFRHTASAGKLEALLAEAIRDELRLDLTVLVRSSSRLARIVGGNPFLAAGADPGKLLLAFLASPPGRSRVRELVEAAQAPDGAAVRGKEVYLHLPHGYGRSKLSNAFVEKRLGVHATTRNWRTVTALADLAAGA